MSPPVSFPWHLNLPKAWDLLPGHCVAVSYARNQSLCFGVGIHPRDGKTHQGQQSKPLLLVDSRNPCWAGVPRPGQLGITIFLGRPQPRVHSCPVLCTGTIAWLIPGAIPSGLLKEGKAVPGSQWSSPWTSRPQPTALIDWLIDWLLPLGVLCLTLGYSDSSIKACYPRLTWPQLIIVL